jgi:hypothetical protein
MTNRELLILSEESGCFRLIRCIRGLFLGLSASLPAVRFERRTAAFGRCLLLGDAVSPAVE